MLKKAIFVCAVFATAATRLNSGEPPGFQVRETKVHNGMGGRANTVFEVKGHNWTCYVFATPQEGSTLLRCENSP